MGNNSRLVMFSSIDGNITVDVKLEQDTVWLTQKQISDLFDKERSVITKHINNIFKELELDKESNVQNLHIANSDKLVAFYNLDVIISIGYRVKSKRGVEFRKWANSVLKDYLLKGYAINQNVINTTRKEYQNLVELLSKTLTNNLVSQQGQNIVELIHSYSTTWSTLLQYDEDRLVLPNNLNKSTVPLNYDYAISAINELKTNLININEATALFGNERNDNLQSILANLDQTMFCEELYKSVEEKAANLLYMAIKDHPFSDGNKRIGSFLFILYIKINKITVSIDNIGLTSLALLIAESNPQQKDLIVRLIVNLLNTK